MTITLHAHTKSAGILQTIGRLLRLASGGTTALSRKPAELVPHNFKATKPVAYVGYKGQSPDLENLNVHPGEPQAASGRTLYKIGAETKIQAPLPPVRPQERAPTMESTAVRQARDTATAPTQARSEPVPTRTTPRFETAAPSVANSGFGNNKFDTTMGLVTLGTRTNMSQDMADLEHRAYQRFMRGGKGATIANYADLGATTLLGNNAVKHGIDAAGHIRSGNYGSALRSGLYGAGNALIESPLGLLFAPLKYGLQAVGKGVKMLPAAGRVAARYAGKFGQNVLNLANAAPKVWHAAGTGLSTLGRRVVNGVESLGRTVSNGLRNSLSMARPGSHLLPRLALSATPLVWGATKAVAPRVGWNTLDQTFISEASSPGASVPQNSLNPSSMNPLISHAR